MIVLPLGIKTIRKYFPPTENSNVFGRSAHRPSVPVKKHGKGQAENLGQVFHRGIALFLFFSLRHKKKNKSINAGCKELTANFGDGGLGGVSWM